MRRLTMKWGLTKRNEDISTSLGTLNRDISRMFDDFFSIKPSSMFEFEWAPAIDVHETDNSIHVKAEIPGMSEKDINVSIENNVLTISGEKNEEKKSENKKYAVCERRFGSFFRSIALPDGIKRDGIKAAYKNGVLDIEIPKEASVKPAPIKIDVK
jgi:HSP20 family protein